MNKKIREIVYAKYKGHCAYCGCELEMKDMQIDHIVPKCRNYEKWAKEIGTDDIDNLNPSCWMCNYYKRMDSLEGFRERLTDMLMRNVRRPFDYRLAVKYGLVKEDIKKVKFYFESQGVKVKEIKTIEERADRAICEPTDGHPQEQPEIELDKFANKIDAFTERYKNNPERISIKGAMAFMARMFYQYPSVAREWYETLPKVTMD